jgi:hypothetical protein
VAGELDDVQNSANHITNKKLNRTCLRENLSHLAEEVNQLFHSERRTAGNILAQQFHSAGDDINGLGQLSAL